MTQLKMQLKLNPTGEGYEELISEAKELLGKGYLVKRDQLDIVVSTKNDNIGYLVDTFRKLVEKLGTPVSFNAIPTHFVFREPTVIGGTKRTVIPFFGKSSSQLN